MKKVLIVGAARESTGGVTTVLNLCEKMPMWKLWSCYWLGTQLHGSYWRKIFFAVRAIIKSFIIIWKYDIVHFHTTPDKFGLLIQLPILLLAKFGRKKTIMHIHVGNQLEDNVGNYFFIWWMKQCDAVVLLAKKWKNLFEKLYPTVKTPTFVIYNACGPTESLPMGNKTESIVFVGSLNPNKAPEILIKAWAKIADVYPNWKVYFLGDGSTEEVSKQLTLKLGLTNSIEFLGFCTGEELHRYFSRASIYVMCSFNEGFPMSTIEAWAYGAAVITTPVGGLPDVIAKGENCLTFNFGDSDELASCLKRLIGDSELREQLSRKGKQTVYESFSMESVNAEYDKLYRYLLN